MPINSRLPADIEHRLLGLGEAIADACPDVEFAYVFGSVATGRRTPQSDVDLAIHVAAHADRHVARLEVVRIAARHLGTDAVEVVVLNVAPIALSGRVLGSRRVLLDRQPFVRHRYESRVTRMFHDFRVREHRLLAQRYLHGRP